MMPLMARSPGAFALALALAATPGLASHLPLDDDPDHYLVLAMRKARLKNLAIESPGPSCTVSVNVGVNCECGLLRASGAEIPEPGQVVANRVCASGSFYQVFRNLLGYCAPDCDMIGDDAATPDCTQAWTPPIIGDLDGDSTPSCDGNCHIDPGDVAAACGVALPLPMCNPLLGVLVQAATDCDGVSDAVPGNGRCDLPAGTYGTITVQDGGRLDFGAGQTVVCNLLARNAVRITSSGPATVIVPGKGKVKVVNGADVGGSCNALRIVAEDGLIRFGRHGDYNLDACVLNGKLRLGQGNNLRGHFMARDIISSFNNDGRCCEDVELPPTTTLPSTTSSSSSSSSTSSTSSSTSTSSPTTTSSSTTSSSSSSTTTTATTSSTTSTIVDPGSTTTSTGATTSSTSSTTSTTATTTSTTSTTTTTVPLPTTTTSSTSSTTSTTATTTTTTTTTMPAGDWTRSAGFYKNHPTVTGDILTDSGGIAVCGRTITNLDPDDCRSALEALCIEVHGDQRRQLVRQLTAAALTMAAGGATFTNFGACDAVCQNASATKSQLANCIEQTDDFNVSGDNLPSPIDTGGGADHGPCDAAFDTTCWVLDGPSCLVCP